MTDEKITIPLSEYRLLLSIAYEAESLKEYDMFPALYGEMLKTLDERAKKYTKIYTPVKNTL